MITYFVISLMVSMSVLSWVNTPYYTEIVHWKGDVAKKNVYKMNKRTHAAEQKFYLKILCPIFHQRLIQNIKANICFTWIKLRTIICLLSFFQRIWVDHCNDLVSYPVSGMFPYHANCIVVLYYHCIGEGF